MRHSYRTGLEAGGAVTLPDVELAHQELASGAHKALWRLAHCGVWGLTDQAARQFVEEAETALAALLDPVGRGES